MLDINLKKIVSGSMAETITKVEAALKTQGFGVLTRIDFDKKIKEKLGKDMPETIILGACNPAVAYEAVKMNSEVTALLPCNVVLRGLENGKILVEMAKPSALMKIMGDEKLTQMTKEVDAMLANALAMV